MVGVVMSAAAVKVNVPPVTTDWLCGSVLIDGVLIWLEDVLPERGQLEAAAKPRCPSPSARRSSTSARSS